MNPSRSLIAFAATMLLSLGAAACGSDKEKTTSGAQTSSTEQPQATTTQDTNGRTTETTPPKKDDGTVIVLKGGEPVGGQKSIKAKTGDKVKLTVESDEEVDIHLHGYEIKKTAKPGEPAVFEFDADIPGVVTMEVENTGTQIAELEVS